MRPHLFPLLALALSGSLGNSAEHETVEFEGLRDPVRIVVPETIETGRNYPAVFYFHGTGENPPLP